MNKVENIEKHNFSGQSLHLHVPVAIIIRWKITNYTLSNAISPPKNPWCNTESIKQSIEYHFLACFLFLSRIHTCKAKQPLWDMELQEKEVQKC